MYVVGLMCHVMITSLQLFFIEQVGYPGVTKQEFRTSVTESNPSYPMHVLLGEQYFVRSIAGPPRAMHRPLAIRELRRDDFASDAPQAHCLLWFSYLQNI